MQAFEKIPFTRSHTGVGASFEDIGAAQFCSPGGMAEIMFELANQASTPSTALADFQLLLQPHPDASFHAIITGSDWGTVAGNLKEYVGTLNTLAAASEALAHVDIGPAYAFKFRAKSAGTDILSNGTFTSNANDWTLGAGWAYGTNDVDATAADTTLKQALADMSTGWTDGVIYEVIFTISGYSAGTLQVGTNTDPNQKAVAVSDDGTYTVKVTADDHADGLVFTADGFTGTIDTVSATPTVPVQVLGSAFR